MEENNTLNKTHENTKKEFQTVIATHEGKVKEHTSNETSLKSEIENLKAVIQENAVLKNNLKDLEEKLAEAQKKITELVSNTP